MAFGLCGSLDEQDDVKCVIKRDKYRNTKSVDGLGPRADTGDVCLEAVVDEPLEPDGPAG